MCTTAKACSSRWLHKWSFQADHRGIYPQFCHFVHAQALLVAYHNSTYKYTVKTCFLLVLILCFMLSLWSTLYIAQSLFPTGFGWLLTSYEFKDTSLMTSTLVLFKVLRTWKCWPNLVPLSNLNQALWSLFDILVGLLEYVWDGLATRTDGEVFFCMMSIYFLLGAI